MKFVIMLLLFPSLICFAQEKCVLINGTVKDKINNEPLEAIIEIQIGNVKKKMTSCDKSGLFSLQLPCEASHILINVKNYRTLTLPLNNTRIDQPFVVELFMIPNDKESLDKPYMQSEQHDLVVKSTDKDPLKKSTHWFAFSDAYTKQNLDAEFCLFYNKKDTVQCYTVTKEKKQKVIFEEEDIVAIEVKADGYEEYSGNIHISNLDNKSITHEISLLKTNRLLSLSKPKGFPENAEVRLYNTDSVLIMPNQAKILYYDNLSTSGNYKIKTAHNHLISESTAEVREGLNFHVLNIPTDTTNFENTSIELDHQTSFRVYFDQSGYKLNKKQEEVLDAILAILKLMPDRRIEIAGHTDNVGNPKLNLQLSELRAKVCYSYFVNRKIDPKRMVFEAYGGARSISSNDTEENREKNRRVEILILK